MSLSSIAAKFPALEAESPPASIKEKPARSGLEKVARFGLVRKLETLKL
jgi:hypothetical protein